MKQPGPGEWDDLVVICAANEYAGIKLADQHFAEQLSALVPVLYVDPPASLLAPLKDPGMASLMVRSKLSIQGPHLAQLTPLVQPFPSRRGLTGTTAALVRRYLRRSVAKLGCGNVSAVISAWPQYPVFGACAEKVSIYWAQDDFVGGAALLGFDAHQIETSERSVGAAADLVVAANPLVAENWRERERDVVLIPFGADVDAYCNLDQAPPAQDVDLPKPVVGVVGQINSRTDIRLLEAIAARGRSLLLVGPRDPGFEPQRFDALVRRANVCWVGFKPFSVLPSYLRAMDVGVVPYSDNPFNRGSFPLKILEYLAAGRAVVSTDLPAVRWLATDLVAVASEPELFADHVDRALAEAGNPALMARRREFAGRHSWAKRAAQIHDIIADQRSQRGFQH